MARLLIIGSGGRLGSALLRAYREKFDVVGLNHAQIDLADFDEIEQLLTPIDYDLLINCAAMTNVDMCEEQREDAFRINAGAPEIMADISDMKNARVIHFSTDYVFAGEKRTPYAEGDEAVPVSIYGQSKLEGDEAVLAAHDRNLVVRVSWVFGPDRPSFIDAMIKRARDNERVDAIADKLSTPTYTRDIVEMLPRFFDSESDGGLLHFANGGECSWHQYAQHALDCCQKFGVPIKAKTVEPIKLSDMKNWIAQRPIYSVLSTAKYSALAGESPRSWQDAVTEYVREFVAH